MLSSIHNRLSRDMGIDLGTANTLLCVRGRGIVLDEPSVVATRRGEEENEPLAVGNEAKSMIGRTPGNISAMRPMKDGVIAHFDTTQTMLKYFMNKATRRRPIIRPRVVVAVPSGVTDVEKRVVTDASLRAGARESYLIEEPMAAAIGAGLPIHEPTGSMVVDIGGGTMEVAVISLGGIVTHQSIRVAGDEMDESIADYVKRHYSLYIGARTAEEVKMEIGSAVPGDNEEAMEVRGRDLVSGLPKTIRLTPEEVREAISEPLSAIMGAIRGSLEQTPPELSSDIITHGIVLTGGGAMLRGLEELVTDETGIPTYLADEPSLCVVRGTDRVLEELDVLKGMLMT